MIGTDLSGKFEQHKKALLAAFERQDPRVTKRAIETWGVFMLSNPGCFFDWRQTSLSLVAVQGKSLLREANPKTLLVELRLDESAWTDAVVQVLGDDCNTEALHSIGLSILEFDADLESDAATRIALRIASLLAISAPSMSQELLDFAVPRMPGENQQLVARLESLHHSAPVLFEVFSGTGGQFIGNILAEPGEEQKWKSIGGVTAINQLRAKAYKGWPGIEILQRFAHNREFNELLVGMSSKAAFGESSRTKVLAGWALFGGIALAACLGWIAFSKYGNLPRRSPIPVAAPSSSDGPVLRLDPAPVEAPELAPKLGDPDLFQPLKLNPTPEEKSTKEVQLPLTSPIIVPEPLGN